jgi:hypothetical protein
VCLPSPRLPPPRSLREKSASRGANGGFNLLKQAGLLGSENTILSKQCAITTEAQLRETARALLAEDEV